MSAGKTVRLRNGTDESEPLVRVLMMSLRSLLGNPLALYELAELAKDRNHEVWGDLDKPLKDLGLISPDGDMHDSVRNVVLSATEGEGAELHLVSPLFAAPDPPLMPGEYLVNGPDDPRRKA